MRRRQLVRSLLAPLTPTLWPGTGFAEPGQRPAVVGRLHPGSADDPLLRATMLGFDDGMRALGHVSGRTYRVDSRFGEGDAGRLPALATALVGARVDIIVAAGAQAIRAAMQATQAIPIVMAMSGPDPVGEGLVASLARPGGNVTGLTGQIGEVQAKQLELLREIVPALSDVLVLFNPNGSRTLPEIQSAATTLGLRLHLTAITQADDLDAAFARPTARGTWAVLSIGDPAVIDGLRAAIAARSLRLRLPSAHSLYASPQAGVLVSYAIDLVDMNRRSAAFVDKILKGARPADIPVERPTKFELAINQATAHALGIVVPPSVLQRADEVIE